VNKDEYIIITIIIIIIIMRIEHIAGEQLHRMSCLGPITLTFTQNGNGYSCHEKSVYQMLHFCRVTSLSYDTGLVGLTDGRTD